MGNGVDVDYSLAWVPMRDGVKLATEIYLPKTTEKVPVILSRSPYNKAEIDACESGADPNIHNPDFVDLAARGYAVLNQDIRGTSRSQGILNPIHQEANDGYDAVEWAAHQSWSNGKVGLSGASYLGLCALQAAIAQPPHLVALQIAVTASDYHDHWTYTNGVFNLWFAQSWLLNTFACDTYRRHLKTSTSSADARSAELERWMSSGNKKMRKEWVQHQVLDDFPDFRSLAPYYYQWLAHPDYDDFWSSVDVEAHYDRIKVPVFSSGGWYDIFAVGSVRNFQGLQTMGGSNAARASSKLLMTPTCHAENCGPIRYSHEAFSLMGDPDANNRWWDYWLKGIDNGLENEPAARVFVMEPPDTGTEGSGFWLEADTFPLPGTEHKHIYLGSGGKANTLHGDGTLDAARGSNAPSDTFVYDPENPVPTMGGNHLCCSGELPPGAFDQSDIELRDDVLVYTSKALTENLTVIGSVMLHFWASTSACDTDFTAKLVDVHHDDFAQNIVDRIVRARYRKGSKHPPEHIKPDRPYRYSLELGPTAVVFKKGHRMRLEISSSNFPRFARNNNTGNLNGEDAKLHKAVQRILHSEDYPSYLSLPVVNEAEIRRESGNTFVYRLESSR